MCFHVLMDMPVPQACRERPTSLRFTASHRRIVASSNCPTSASPSSYCLIAKGPRGVGEQFAVVGFGFGRPSVFVRRGRYLAGVVRMLIPSFTVPLPPPPPSSTSRGTYQRHPPRKTRPPHLLFLVRSCCWSCWPFASFSCLVVRWFGGCVVLCVLRSGAAVLLWELRCCAAVRLCCCLLCCSGGLCCVWCVCRVWFLRGVLVCRACGVLVSCLCVVLVCGTFYTMPVWCLCVLPACGAEHGWCLTRLKTDTAPMLPLHRT